MRKELIIHYDFGNGTHDYVATITEIDWEDYEQQDKSYMEWAYDYFYEQALEEYKERLL